MAEPIQATEREVHLKDYLKVLQKRLWVIIAVFIITVAVAFLQVSGQEPLYRARTRIQIERLGPQILNIQEVVAPEYGYLGDEYYQTQFVLMKSRSLAEEVIGRLDLAENPDFLPKKGRKTSLSPLRAVKIAIKQAKAFVGLDDRKKIELAKVASRDPKIEEKTVSTGLINAFLGMIEISPLKGTRLVDVNAVSRNPKLAADMANTLAEAYIDLSQQQRVSTTREASNWLAQELEEAGRKVQESEMALQRYKEAQDIISLEDRQNVVVQKLESLNAAMTGAKTERIALEIRHGQMERIVTGDGKIDSLPEIIENAFIQQLKTEYGQLQNELSDLSKTYTPKHPRIIRLQSQIESVQDQMKAEIEKVKQSIITDYELAQAKERSLQETMEQQKREVQSLNQKSIQYTVLEREVENNRRIYDILLSRAKETGLAEGLEKKNIRIIDRAEIPLSPFAPKKFQAIMMAMMVGVFSGIGLAFFIDYLDDSIKDPDDLEQYVRLPLLATVPIIKTKKKGGPKELIADRETKSLYAEAYRSARTSIMFSSPDSPAKTILVTSPGPQDGKTLTAANLAITMAHAGNRVLLIDADMRKPRVHAIFGFNNKYGLTNLLIESADVKHALHKASVANLAVLTCGPIPPNPSELLVSERMKVLMKALHEKFDRIIIDSPPSISVTDANILATMVDGVIMVIRGSRTSRKIVNRARKGLLEVGGRILGVMLNAVDMRKSRYYYAPYYYYSYYSSDKGEKRKTG